MDYSQLSRDALYSERRLAVDELAAFGPGDVTNRAFWRVTDRLERIDREITRRITARQLAARRLAA